VNNRAGGDDDRDQMTIAAVFLRPRCASTPKPVTWWRSRFAAEEPMRWGVREPRTELHDTAGSG
jgi:hypothetical protein